MKKNYFLLAATTMMLAACAQTDVVNEIAVEETPQAIGFETFANKQTRADDASTAEGKFGSYAPFVARFYSGEVLSQIGKEMVKKYTGDSDEVPIGIIVNDPVVMDSGHRKASVLVLGQLYRLKLASGITDISPADKIKLGENGAVKDSSGEYLALHPVEDSDEYNYVNCFKLASGGAGGEKGDTGDTGPAGPKGDTGDTGPMTIIKGSYDTLEELIAAHPTGQPGDAYIVAGDLYIWEE